MKSSEAQHSLPGSHACIGLLDYFGSDLEGDLLLPVDENSTFNAHMVHCPSISETTVP